MQAQGNTPPISTADTSLLTNVLSSFFIGQSQFNRRDQNAWFKQILNYKNTLAGGGGGYLQTIESEEVMGTEGHDVLSQMGNTGINSSVVVTQSNFDDNLSRKSFMHSFNAQQQQLNNHSKSRESSLKSFNSGGTPMIRQP